MLEDGFDGHNHSQRAMDEDLGNDIAVDDYNSADSEDSDSDDDMEIRLGQVDGDFSDEEEGDEEVFSSSSESDDEEGFSSTHSDDEDESEVDDDSEPSDDADSENEIDPDENDEMFIDGTEQEVDERDEGGWGRLPPIRNVDEEEMFDGGNADEVDFGDPDEIGEGDEIGEDWTAVNAGDAAGRLSGMMGGGPLGGPEGFANVLMDALQRSGRGQGNQGLQAVGNMLSGFLREGRIQELEDTLGIRVMQTAGRRAVGLRFPAGNSRLMNQDEESIENLPASSSLPVHQRSAPDAGYGTLSMSNRSLSESLPMEYLFGGPAAGAGSEYYSRSSSTNIHREEITQSSSELDTFDLFPGGVVSSTHSRQSLVPHPLIAGVDLPPINALLTNTARLARSPNSNDRRLPLSSGAFIRSQGGVLRVNRSATSNIDPLSGTTGPPTALSLGWRDDSSPLDNTTEDFGSLFGQALIDTNEAISDDIRARNAVDSTQDTDPSQNINSSNEFNEASTETHHAETESSPPAETTMPQVSTANSGDHVDVSRLSISQHESDSHSTTSINTHQRATAESHEDEEAEAEQNDAEMLDENSPADERVNEGQNISEQNRSGENNDQELASESGDQDAVGEVENYQAGVNTEEITRDQAVAPVGEEATGEESLTCPPDVDVEVFNSLPLEMQREICREHTESTSGIAEQIGDTSGLDPEALA